MVMMVIGFFFEYDISKRHTTQRVVIVAYKDGMCEGPAVYAIDDLYSGLASWLEHGLEG